jgi:AcrR family transcriptional regulator
MNEYSFLELAFKGGLMEKGKLSRRQREKQRHKEEILNSALSLFSEKGFHNVSMQDIANASEFGTGTLYNFFPSKEQLFIELIGKGISRFGHVLYPILDSNEPEEKKLSKYIQAHVGLIETNIEYFKLYISHYGTKAPRSPVFKEAVQLKKSVSKKLAALIKAGIEKKVFDCLDPEVAALSIRSALEAFSLETSENFDKEKTQQGFYKIEEFFLKALSKNKS